MFRKTGKLSTAMVVALFTAVLYGCGGGGDDSADSLAGPTGPTPAERVTELEATITALEAALAEDQELTPATIEALVTATDALAALRNVMLDGDRMLDPDGLAALVEAADALAALKGVMLGAGRTLDPTGLAALVEAADAFAALKDVTLQPGQTLDAATLGQLVTAAGALKDLMNEYATLLLVAEEEGVLLTANMLREYIMAYQDAQDDTGREQAAKDYLRARMIAARLSPVDTADPPMRAVHNTLPMFLGGTDRDEDNTAINTHVMVASSGSHMIDVDDDPEMDVDMTDVEFARVGTTPGLVTSADSSLATRWTGRVLERALPGGRDDHVVVYSDVRAPWQETFRRAYASLADGVTKPVPPTPLAPQGELVGGDVNETEAQFNVRKEAHDAALVIYNAALATYNTDQKTVASGDFVPATPYLGWSPGDAQYAGNQPMGEDARECDSISGAVLDPCRGCRWQARSVPARNSRRYG